MSGCGSEFVTHNNAAHTKRSVASWTMRVHITGFITSLHRSNNRTDITLHGKLTLHQQLPPQHQPPQPPIPFVTLFHPIFLRSISFLPLFRRYLPSHLPYSIRSPGHNSFGSIPELLATTRYIDPLYLNNSVFVVWLISWSHQGQIVIYVNLTLTLNGLHIGFRVTFAENIPGL